MDCAHYLVFRGRPSLRGRWRFRLVASNGENVGPASQGFRDSTDAKRGVLAHARAAMEAAGGSGRPMLDHLDVRVA